MNYALRAGFRLATTIILLTGFAIAGSGQTVGSTSRHSYYGGEDFYDNPVWSLSSSIGVIGSSWAVKGGSEPPFTWTYYVEVTWNMPGAVVLTMRNGPGGSVVATRNITVGCNAITKPGYTLSTGNFRSFCGPKQVTMTLTPGSGGSQVRYYTTAVGGTAAVITAPLTVNLTSSTAYYFTTYNTTTGCESQRQEIAFTISPVPGPATAIGPAPRCGEGPVTLAGSPGSNANTLQWYDADQSPIAGAAGVTLAVELTGTATLYMSSYSISTGCTSPVKVPIQAIINPVPGKPENVTDDWIYGSGSAKLTVAVDCQGCTVNWFSNGQMMGTPLSITRSYTTPTLSATQTYYVRSVSGEGCLSDTAWVYAKVINNLASPSNIRMDVIRRSGVTDTTTIRGLPDTDKNVYHTYFDGLSRAVQQVIVKGSMDGKDIIQPIEYDGHGKNAKQYLPYVPDASNGRFRPLYEAEQAAFYATAGDRVANDAKPYATTLFEASPLGRVIEQGSFGHAWQPGTGHTNRVTYRFNTGATAITSTETIRRFKSDGSTTQHYSANKLHRIQTTDENDAVTLTFKNTEGLVVAKKEQLNEVIDGVTVTYLETYYIYDDFNRIKYILPPKGMVAVKANGWVISAAILEQHCYQFVYDHRGRLIEKKVPGQAWSYYVYDDLGRIVLTQDGLLRTQNKWTFQKYNRAGGTVMLGLYTNTVQTTRANIQQLVDKLYRSSNVSYPENAYYEKRGSSLHGYTNISFPKTNADNTPLEVMTVSYYETHDFDFNGTDDFSYAPQSLPGEGTPVAPLGYNTGGKRLVLGTSTWIYNYLFYDKYGRVIQVRGNNHMNAAIDNITTNIYDFEGKVLVTKSNHKAGAGNDVAVEQQPVYDAKGRLTEVGQQTESAEAVTWSNLGGMVVEGVTIKKTGTSNSWAAGAYSHESIPANQDGLLQFKIPAANLLMVGASTSDGGVGYNTINYAVYAASSFRVFIYENGINLGQVSTYQVNDVFSIERVNGIIYYKKNDQIIYTSGIMSTGELHMDCSFSTPGAWITNTRIRKKRTHKIAGYAYNALGQLVDKKLYEASGSAILQSVDYRYNIRGWLESINNASLNTNSENNDDTNDYFGMEFSYATIYAGLANTPAYNGNITAIRWKGPGDDPGATDQKSYKYVYDRINRLKSAATQSYSGTQWNKDVGLNDEIVTYDHNGNIATLRRNQRKYQAGSTPSFVPEMVDNLVYTYEAGASDRLVNVQDGSGSQAGFTDGADLTAEYTYDVNGNMLTDQNKGISGMVYNWLGKPETVTFGDGRKTEYTYDAMGVKLTVKNYAGTTLLRTTQYIGDFVYEDGALSFFGAPEGRVMVDSAGKLSYQYAIADHQGNTRVVFSAATPEPVVASTDFESASNTDFENYPAGGTRSSFDLFNHTGGTATYSQLLNGGNNAQIGVAKSFKVYPGDKVKIEAYAKYWNETSNSANLDNFAAAITGAFGLDAASTGDALEAFNALNSFGGLIASGDDHGGDPSNPKGFVTILIYDKDHNFIDAAWDQLDADSVQEGTTKSPFDYLSQEVTIRQEGYAYVYLSNESATLVDIYFDDVVMTHTKTNIVQHNEYYPFGLQTPASWTREDHSNNFLYNGGSELNPATGWYEMYYRDYDPALGRMMQIDPFATAYSTLSTYNYAANNPVMLNDPSGGYSREWWQEQQGTGMGAIGLPGFDQNGGMIVESTWDGSGGSPGSGGHWSDGIGYDDWTLYGGSPTYQANMALANQNPGRVYEAHGTFYERIDTYDDWYMLQSDGSWQFFESTFRSTRYERMAAQQGWFSDKQGEIIGMHWLNGSGKPLFFNDKSWTDYMESNSVIGGTIAGILHDDAMTRTQSGTHVQRIFVELAENDRSTGYGMLHGTLNFDYAFKATMINNKQIEYSCTFMWNDRIDPSTRQGDTPWVMAAKLRYSPADYDIIIKWTHTYIINK